MERPTVNFLRFVLAMALMVSVSTAKADSIEFDMSVFGYKFGKMVLTKTVKNDSIEVYTLNSKGATNFLWMKREGESKIKVEYRNGILFSSNYEYLKQGELEKWSSIRQVGENYEVQSESGTKEISASLDYSLIKLYFDPSIDSKTVFCEEDCSFAEMTREDNTVGVKCQDGSRSTYHLKDGRVEAMEIHLAMATVKLTRTN